MAGQRNIEAARLLADAWLADSVIEPLPAHLRPRNHSEATAIQDAMARRIGLPVAGWKVGGAPNVGRIFAPRLFATPAVLPVPAFAAARIECELGFRLRHDLPPRSDDYSEAEVAAACALMPCVEITTARVRQARHIAQSPDDVLDILADNAVQGGLVVGAAIDDWRTLSLLDITIDLRIDGGQAVPLNPREDRSEPFKVMVWLVNALSARGIGLSVSQVTTLGSITVSQPLAPGQSAVADYGRFGSIAVAVAAPDEQVIPEKLL